MKKWTIESVSMNPKEVSRKEIEQRVDEVFQILYSYIHQPKEVESTRTDNQEIEIENLEVS